MLTSVVLQLVALGVQVAPSIVSAAQTELKLFQEGGTPTAAEQAAIDAALDQAHAALQAA